MKNISVFIEGLGKKFKFEKPIITYGTRIAAKEVTVFWNFKNVTSTIGNHTFVIKNNPERTNHKRWLLRFSDAKGTFEAQQT